MCWAAENIKTLQATGGALAWLAARIAAAKPPLLN